MKDQFPETVVARVAQAIENSQYERLHESLARIDLKTSEFQSFFSGLREESDRALAIVSYAYIDERLKELFGATLNSRISGGLKSLLEGMGPLSSSGARIQVAAALYWLRPETYQNLGLLRKMRNEFAHQSDAGDFTHKRIAGFLTSMPPLEAGILQVMREMAAFERELTPREVFFVRNVVTCQAMIAEVAAGPVAQRMGLPPMAVFSRGFEKLPSDFQELARAASRAIVSFMSIKSVAEEAAP